MPAGQADGSLYLVLARNSRIVQHGIGRRLSESHPGTGRTGDERVTSNALAQHLGVRAASVTGMLQKLAAQKPSFVKYEKHHGVRLTDNGGSMRALEVLRHHRLLERFLHDFLDYSWDEVHEEAERLEHFISERLEDRIAAKLGDPETDPHGHPIPERNGAVRPRARGSPVEMGLRSPRRGQQCVGS